MAPCLVVAQRVVDDAVERLLDQRDVASDQQWLLGNGALQPHLELARDRSVPTERALRQRPQVDAGPNDLGLSRVQLGGDRQVLGERADVVRLGPRPWARR